MDLPASWTTLRAGGKSPEGGEGEGEEQLSSVSQSVTCHGVNHKLGLLLESFTESRTDSVPSSQ